MTEKRIILFDLGNVLIGWNEDSLYSKLIPDAAARKAYLAKIHFDEWNNAQDTGRSWAEGEAVLIAQFPEDAALIRAYRTRFLETLGAVNAGVVEIMKKLKGEGYTLYAASNWNDETFDLSHSRMTFLSLFDGLHISGRIGLIKPDPAFFLSLMRTYNFRPEEALFIDDKAANVQAAESLGIASIQFHNAEQLSRELGSRNIRGV